MTPEEEQTARALLVAYKDSYDLCIQQNLTPYLAEHLASEHVGTNAMQLLARMLGENEGEIS